MGNGDDESQNDDASARTPIVCVTTGLRKSTLSNEKGSKVEADVAMCPLLSLFRREENRDGDTYVPYALHNY